DGGDFFPFKQGKLLTVGGVEDVLQIHGPVAAFENGRAAGVFAGAGDELPVVGGGAFGEKDVAGAAQAAWRFAQGAARQQVFVAERGLPVHEDDVHAPSQAQVLQSVVENERVRLQHAHGVTARVHAVAVHHHG